MKYRLRPIEPPPPVEAQQWFPGVKIEGIEEKKRSVPWNDKNCFSCEPPYEVYGVIRGVNSIQWCVFPGDWVFRGADGMLKAFPPATFEKLYEPVPDETPKRCPSNPQ